MWKAAEENEQAQQSAEKEEYEETHGKVGHRDPSFLERARAAEAAG